MAFEHFVVLTSRIAVSPGLFAEGSMERKSTTLAA